MTKMSGSHWILSGIAVCLLGAAQTFSDETVTMDGWTLSVDGSGSLRTMSYLNPQTDLNVESELTVTIEGATNATGGTVKFKNGAERPMSPMEALTYFDRFDGQNALWDFLASRNKLTVSKPMTAVLSSMYGSKTRVLIDNGKKLIGTMTSDNNATDHFLLVVPGACCGPVPIYLSSLHEIQQFK
jgi:hypothetical protein